MPVIQSKMKALQKQYGAKKGKEIYFKMEQEGKNKKKSKKKKVKFK